MIQYVPSRMNRRDDFGGLDHFRLSVSCPPDKKVWMRGGILYLGAYYTGDGLYKWVDSVACDFGGDTPIDSNTYTGTFTNPYYFLGIILSIPHQAWGWAVTQVVGSFGIISSQTEFATAVEAEQAIGYMLSGTTDVFTLDVSETSMPLAAIVLKNNGVIGEVGAIEPIDAINRGRSYLWKDLRPRHKSGWYT